MSRVVRSLLDSIGPEISAQIMQQAGVPDAARAIQQALNPSSAAASTVPKEMREVAAIISPELFPDPAQRAELIQSLMGLRPDLIMSAATLQAAVNPVESQSSVPHPQSSASQSTGPAGALPPLSPSVGKPGRVPSSRSATRQSKASPANAVALSPDEAQQLLGRYYPQAMASLQATEEPAEPVAKTLVAAPLVESRTDGTNGDKTGLASMGAGMAKGMRDGLIDSVWNRVQAGKSANIAGGKPPVFEQAVDLAASRGLIRDRDDIAAIYDAGGNKTDTVKVLNSLLQRHQQDPQKQQQSATSSPSAAAQPSSAGSGGQIPPVPPGPPRPPAGGGDEPPDGGDDDSGDSRNESRSGQSGNPGQIDPSQAAAPIGDSPIPPVSDGDSRSESDQSAQPSGSGQRRRRRDSRKQPAFNPRAVFRNLVFGKRGIARNLLATIGRRQAGRQAMRKFGLRPGGMGGRLLGGLAAGYVTGRTVSAGVSSGMSSIGGNTPSAQATGRMAGGVAGLVVGGTVAAGLMAGGPVGLVVAGLAAGLGVLGAATIGLVGKFKEFSETINEGNRYLAKYNGNIAAAFARQDLNRMQMDRQTANETQGTTAWLVNATTASQKAWQPYDRDSKTISNLGAVFGAKISEAFGGMYSTAREILGFGAILDQIEKNTRKEDRGGIPVEVMAAFKAQPNDPFAGLRQPINPQWEIRP
jgi:hypothetical protein